MSNITLRVIERYPDLDYDIYEALEWYYPDWDVDIVTLWGSGCRMNGTWNCTKACIDTTEGPAMVWNSPGALSTISNCIMYPLIATAAAQGRISTERPGLLEEYDIVANVTLPANSSNMEAWPVLSGCIREMCFRYKGRDDENGCLLSDYVFLNGEDITSVDPVPPKIVRLFCIVSPLLLEYKLVKQR